MSEIELRSSVKWFAEQMETKLRKDNELLGPCHTHYLMAKLEREYQSLIKVYFEDDEPNIMENVVDIANLCMIIGDKVRGMELFKEFLATHKAVMEDRADSPAFSVVDT